MITTKTSRTNTAIQYRFSLVEILVAIAIIAILLGLSGAGYTAVQRKIARSRTEATLNKLRVGLESYKSKFGYYPQQLAIGPFHLDINDPRVPEGQPQNNFNSFIEYSKISKEDSVVVGSYLVNGNPVNYYAVIDGFFSVAASSNRPHPAFVIQQGGTEDVGPVILYMCPGLVNTSSYDLFSAGYDRTYRWTNSGDENNSVNTDNIWPQGLKQK